MYNGNIGIGDFYESDDSTTQTNMTSNPAFVSVQLTNVSPNPLNRAFGNFSSILTVDLTQLEQQNIKNITCGDPVIMDTVPVDITITQETVPGNLLFIGLSVLVLLTTMLETSNGELNSVVLISWMELQPVRLC